MRFEETNNYIIQNGSIAYEEFLAESIKIKNNDALEFFRNLFESFDAFLPYSKNITNIIKEVDANPRKFIKVLDYRTYVFLKTALNNQLAFQGCRANLFTSDFSLLHALDIVDVEKMNIKPKWKKAMQNVVDSITVRDLKKIKDLTLVIGLLDLYGFIPISNLIDIVNQRYLAYVGTFEVDDVIRMFADSLVLNLNYVITSDYDLVHKMILGYGDQGRANSFINEYAEFENQYDYCEYPYEAVMSFASAHTWSGMLSEAPQCIHKYINLSIMSYLIEVEVDEETRNNNLRMMYLYAYPKWILKGNTIMDYDAEND